MTSVTMPPISEMLIRLRVTHYAAHSERDPDTHPEWKATERRMYTSQASWDREQEIMDEAGGGELVFADANLLGQDRHYGA